MRIPRIYQVGDFEPEQIITLSPHASQHVGRVLRMKAGEKVIIFTGNNYQYLATIINDNKRSIDVKINDKNLVNRESNLSIHLAQCISKSDKMEFVVQKAVELGVNSITPILSERCNVHLDAKRMEKKQHQWQEIAISACEQSGRNTIPLIANPCKIQEYMQICKTKNKFILEPTTNFSWRNYPNLSDEISLLIGPEGGLTNDEVLNSRKFNFNPLNLGPRILRTETASISIISIMQALYGDL